MGKLINSAGSSITLEKLDIYFERPYNPNQEIHTIKKEVILNNNEFSALKFSKLRKCKDGSLVDSFNSYKNFYYEDITLEPVSDIYNKHEWFRLYGIDRETDIKNALRIKRDSREGLILVNGIPINYTDCRLVFYNDVEYVVPASGMVITKLGCIYTPSFKKESSENDIIINSNGIVSIGGEGDSLYSADKIIIATKGCILLPDGYTASNNYIVTDLNGKLVSDTGVINYYNKVFDVTSNVKVFIPLKKSQSMFEELMKLNITAWYVNLNKKVNGSTYSFPETAKTDIYTVQPSNSSRTSFLKSMKTNIDMQLNRVSGNIISETYLYPDIKEIPRNMLSTGKTEVVDWLEKYFDDMNAIQRDFTIHELSETYILYDDNIFGMKINSPKIMIPIFNEKNKTVLLYMNGRLKNIDPEIVTTGSQSYILLELLDVYNKKFEDFDNSYNNIVEWYKYNAVDNLFEIVLYDSCKYVKGDFTIYNEGIIPLPIDYIGNESFLEIYVDGFRIPVDKVKIGLYGISDLNTNMPQIPVIYTGISNTIGKKFVVIHKGFDKSYRRYKTISKGAVDDNGNPAYFLIAASISEQSIREDFQAFSSNGEKIYSSFIKEVFPGQYFVAFPYARDINFYYKTRSKNITTVEDTDFTVKSLNAEMINNTPGYTEIYAYIKYMQTVIPDYRNYTTYPTFISYSSLEGFAWVGKYDFFLHSLKSYHETTYSETTYISKGNAVNIVNNLGVSKTEVVPTVPTTMSSYVFTAYKKITSNVSDVTIGALIGDTSNNFIKMKIAYLYSLWAASLHDEYYTGLVKSRLFNVNDIANEKSFKIPQDVLDRYNEYFGTTLNTDTSFSVDNLGSVFLLYNRLPFVAVPYGIVSKEYCYEEKSPVMTSRVANELGILQDSAVSITAVMSKYGGTFNKISKV